MKKVVYYARVSTSLQEEKGTIESQKTELINQIKKDGNILVKEYIDAGWSGARLDRPALDELRNDIKTDLFEAVYFLDSDRIARDVSYQNIIISELLKHEKDIIIKGKSYIHNPENKFTLTVLGAVNELEKAKIVERMMRGRREHARQGSIVDGGGLFGYDHIKKTEEKRGYYKINEEQAEIVKFIYETYAYSNVSLTGLIKLLEEKGYKTSTGKTYWKSSVIRRVLTNESYFGDHHFNRTERVESKKVKSRYAKSMKTSVRIKDRSEWITVPINPIISRELFDTVQSKLKRNHKLLRSSTNKYLLGGLVKCGVCEHTYSGVTWKGIKYYRCNYRDKLYHHNNLEDLIDCKNESVKSETIDDVVVETVLDKILQPAIIKKHIDVLKNTKQERISTLKNHLVKIDGKIESMGAKKKKILDLYSDGLLERDAYAEKIKSFEDESNKLSSEKEELSSKISLLEQRSEIKKNINYFCKLARKRYSKLDRDGRINFIKTLIDEVVIVKNETKKLLVIKGVLPVLADNSSSLPHYCTSHRRCTCWRW